MSLNDGRYDRQRQNMLNTKFENLIYLLVSVFGFVCVSVCVWFCCCCCCCCCCCFFGIWYEHASHIIKEGSSTFVRSNDYTQEELEGAASSLLLEFGFLIYRTSNFRNTCVFLKNLTFCLSAAWTKNPDAFPLRKFSSLLVSLLLYPLPRLMFWASSFVADRCKVCWCSGRGIHCRRVCRTRRQYMDWQ